MNKLKLFFLGQEKEMWTLSNFKNFTGYNLKERVNIILYNEFYKFVDDNKNEFYDYLFCWEFYDDFLMSFLYKIFGDGFETGIKLKLWKDYCAWDETNPYNEYEELFYKFLDENVSEYISYKIEKFFKAWWNSKRSYWEEALINIKRMGYKKVGKLYEFGIYRKKDENILLLIPEKVKWLTRSVIIEDVIMNSVIASPIKFNVIERDNIDITLI